MSPEPIFGWPFRARARAWLASIPPRSGTVVVPRAFQIEGERVVFLETARIAAGQTVDDLLMVRGDLVSGPACHFRRPVYVAGNCEIGKRSRVESIEADGSLLLGAETEVEDYAAAGGEVELRPGCRVRGRVWTESSLRLGLHCSVRALRAMQAATSAVRESSAGAPAGAGVKPATLPAPGEPVIGSVLIAVGILAQRLRVDGRGGWIHKGDLALTAPVVLRTPLAVDGSFSCEPGTLLQVPVQARGSITLGAGSVAQAGLTAGADLALGRGCVFQGDLWCGQMMRLCAGVRGVRRGGPLSIWANGELSLEEDVVVRGEIASAFRVASAPAERPATQAQRAPELRQFPSPPPRPTAESANRPAGRPAPSMIRGNRRAG